MYTDAVVIAGIATAILACAFFGGVGWFIYKDSHRKVKQKDPRH
ncbi:cytochrome c oxidase subunit CcoM [Marinobacter sp. JSM 1782161]|nr:cytochrome c oxidase subunit CcoM [Marinobacter sp. JSM 1782161]